MTKAKKTQRKRAPGAGRPALPAEERLEVAPSFRFPRALIKRIEEVAARSGLTRSEWMRAVVERGLNEAEGRGSKSHEYLPMESR